MTPELEAKCFKCKHYKGAFCEAFGTKGIPYEIALGENDHSKSLPEQDNDIVFEEIDHEGIDFV